MLSCKGVLRGLTTVLVGFFCFNSLMQTVAAGADRGLLGYHWRIDLSVLGAPGTVMPFFSPFMWCEVHLPIKSLPGSHLVVILQKKSEEQ